MRKEIIRLHAKLAAHLSREQTLTKKEKSKVTKLYWSTQDLPENFRQMVEDLFEA